MCLSEYKSAFKPKINESRFDDFSKKADRHKYEIPIRFLSSYFPPLGETKQPLFKRMTQHNRENSSGPQSAVRLQLEARNHTFENKEVKTLAREKG